jgi:hypothetical protein
MTDVSTVSPRAIRPVEDVEMVQLADVEIAQEQESQPAPYLARVAICFMVVGGEGDNHALYNQLTETLKEDSRVETIDVPLQDEHSYSRPILSSFGSFSSDDTVDEDEAPDPFSHLHAFTFRRPILLQIRSPRRLQPNYNSFKHIPADRYWVAWDGIALAVLWELEDLKEGSTATIPYPTIRRALSPSAGLLAQSVLRDAVEKCGSEFRTIACSPNCDYTFFHSKLVVNTVGEAGSYGGDAIFNNEEDRLIAVDLPVEHTPEKATLALYRCISFPARVFAKLRSAGQTLESATWLAHEDVAELLRLNYERAAMSAKPFWKSLRERWSSRRWRREARQIVARICLDLATMENVRGDWARAKQIYEDSAKSNNVGVVFGSEYELGAGAVSTLDVTEARSAIDRMTGSLDIRALVLATAVAAVVGALIGALVTSLM